MLCRTCGYMLSVTAKFCPGCGATVADTAPLSGSAAALGALTPNPRFNQPVPARTPAPPVAPPVSTMVTDTYFLLLNGQQSGPYTVNQMRSMWQSGTINAGTHYWQEGMPTWQALANIRHFLDAPAGNAGNQIIVNQVSQVNQTAFAQPMMAYSPKSRGTFIVLGFFFGCLGVHNFYAGYSGKGVAQLLITVCVGWFFGIGLFVTAVWAFIEIIGVNTDAHGLRMT